MGACNSNCISTAKTAVENILNDINRLTRRLNSLDNNQQSEISNSLQQVITLLERGSSNNLGVLGEKRGLERHTGVSVVEKEK